MSLTKYRSITAVSIDGLGPGDAISLPIFNYVWAGFSFESMHSKGDRIYRVESRFYEGDVLTEDWATSSFDRLAYHRHPCLPTAYPELSFELSVSHDKTLLSHCDMNNVV